MEDWMDLLDEETKRLYLAAGHAQGVLVDITCGRADDDAILRAIDAVGRACITLYRKTIAAGQPAVIAHQEEKAA